MYTHIYTHILTYTYVYTYIQEVFFLSDQQGCLAGKNTTNGTQPIYHPPNPWNCSGTSLSPHTRIT